MFDHVASVFRTWTIYGPYMEFSRRHLHLFCMFVSKANSTDSSATPFSLSSNLACSGRPFSVFFSFAVTNVLPRVIPNISSDAARAIFEESKIKGFGIVLVCVKVSRC